MHYLTDLNLHCFQKVTLIRTLLSISNHRWKISLRAFIKWCVKVKQRGRGFLENRNFTIKFCISFTCRNNHPPRHFQLKISTLHMPLPATTFTHQCQKWKHLITAVVRMPMLSMAFSMGCGTTDSRCLANPERMASVHRMMTTSTPKNI